MNMAHIQPQISNNLWMTQTNSTSPLTKPQANMGYRQKYKTAKTNHLNQLQLSMAHDTTQQSSNIPSNHRMNMGQLQINQVWEAPLRNTHQMQKNMDNIPPQINSSHVYYNPQVDVSKSSMFMKNKEMRSQLENDRKNL